MSKKQKPSDEQSQKFIDAARAADCDESEERFDEALKKVARHKPSKGGEDRACESDAKPSKKGR